MSLPPFSGPPTYPATTIAEGKVQLAGDLGGLGTTAASPVVKGRWRVFDGIDYGIVGDNSTDNATFIGNALDAMAAAGGGLLKLPPGIIKTNGTGRSTYNAGYENIGVVGSGRDVTILKLKQNNVALAFGNGNAALGLFGTNYYVADLTVDMAALGGASAGGLAFNNCAGVVLERVKIVNRNHGQHAMLFFGSSVNADSNMWGNGLTVRDCQFGNDGTTAVSNSWEAITLAQAQNIRFEVCTFQNQTKSQAMILNYGSHEVVVKDCIFTNCRGWWSNGFGNSLLDGCSFNNATSFNQAYNVTHHDCDFFQSEDVDLAESAGISYVGYTIGSETFWDTPLAFGTNVQIRNNKVLNCRFDACHANAVNSGVYTGTFDAAKHITLWDFEFVGNTVSNSTGEAIDVKAQQYLRVEDNNAYDSHQDVATPAYNYAVGAGIMVFRNNRSWDDQTVPTVSHDFFIDNNWNALITTQNILMEDNDFQIDGVPRYLTSVGGLGGGGFTLTKPANVEIRGQNNRLMNPNTFKEYGTTTTGQNLSRTNGNYLAMTLGGSWTATVADGNFEDEEMVWQMTQDGTGNRTINIPVNMSPALGGFTLSDAPGSVDLYTWKWDITTSLWQEKSRSISDRAVYGFVDLTSNQTAAGNKTWTGQTTLSSAAASNHIPLTITQSDTTNNPVAAQITNAGTSNGLKITQNGNNTGSAAAEIIQNNGTGTALRINQETALADGARALFISQDQDMTGSNTLASVLAYSNYAHTVGTNYILSAYNDNAASVAGAFLVHQDGTGTALKIANTGTGKSILVNTNDFVLTSTATAGIGVTSPTAVLHLKAGTATASTAPIKLTSGTNLATPEAGAIEFDGTHFYGTISSTRYQLDQQTVAGGSGTFTTITITGTTGTSVSDITITGPSGSITNYTGLDTTGFGNAGLTTTNATHIHIGNAAGTITSVQVGIDIDALTQGATSDIGIRIAKADTYSLQLSDTGGTAAGGIQFGTDSATLYRSAANTLKTDGSLAVHNVTLATAGDKISITTGSNASAGTGTLIGGTATISTTAVTANSLIFLTDTASSITNVGTLTVSAKTAGTSFVVTSTLALDTSTFNWLIIN